MSVLPLPVRNAPEIPGLAFRNFRGPHQDMIFAEVDGTTVGYGRGRWCRQPHGAYLHDLTGHVTSPWRRRGIGRAILRWTEERQRQVASQEAAAGPHLFQLWTLDSEQGLPELWQVAWHGDQVPARCAASSTTP